MKGLKLNKGIIYNVIIIILVIYIGHLRNKEDIVVEVPATENSFFVESPVEKVRFDSIVYRDSIHEVEVVKYIPVENPVNDTLLAKYEEAIKQNDSLKQLALYKDAITERIYEEKFEDSIQVITVESEVIGRLKRQFVHYETKPKVLTVRQPDPERISLFAGGFAYGIEDPVVGVKLNLLNKEKNKIFMVGYDTQKRVHFGVTFKVY